MLELQGAWRVRPEFSLRQWQILSWKWVLEVLYVLLLAQEAVKEVVSRRKKVLLKVNVRNWSDQGQMTHSTHTQEDQDRWV